jgi:hypothetical protein
MHLSSIDTSLLNANGTLNTKSITTASLPVAQSGNTGAALVAGPHLHYEVRTSTTKVCSTGGTDCRYVPNRTDPFPFIASTLNLQEASNQTGLASGATYAFDLTASDIAGVTVSSAVSAPGEDAGLAPNGGKHPATFTYDPTRKVCLLSDPANVILFPSPNNSTTFAGIGSNYCAPWGTSIGARDLATGPDTTITAHYSSDPTVSASLDPLSTTSASLTLIAKSKAGSPIFFTEVEQKSGCTFTSTYNLTLLIGFNDGVPYGWYQGTTATVGVGLGCGQSPLYPISGAFSVEYSGTNTLVGSGEFYDVAFSMTARMSGASIAGTITLATSDQPDDTITYTPNPIAFSL